jgi:hypothetical protein
MVSWAGSSDPSSGLVAYALVVAELVVAELVVAELVVAELVVAELVVAELVVAELVVAVLVVADLPPFTDCDRIEQGYPASRSETLRRILRVTYALPAFTVLRMCSRWLGVKWAGDRASLNRGVYASNPASGPSTSISVVSVVISIIFVLLFIMESFDMRILG